MTSSDLISKGQAFKLVCLALYALIVGGITFYAHQARGAGPHTVAVRAIEKDQSSSPTPI